MGGAGVVVSHLFWMTPALLNLPTHIKGLTQLHKYVPPQAAPSRKLKGMHFLLKIKGKIGSVKLVIKVNQSHRLVN